MKYIFSTFILLLTINLSYAQNDFEDFDFDEIDTEEETKATRIYLDLGGNTFVSNDYSAFELNHFKSRSFNLTSMKVFPIAKGLFNYNLGTNFGFEGYNFKKDIIMTNVNDSTSFNEDPNSTTDSIDYIKSKLATTYFDIIMEFEFAPSKSNKGFKLAVGGKAGILINAYNKRKVKIDDEITKYKTSNNFNLNRFRYGVYGRLIYNKFGAYAYYSLSDLFKKDKGPELTPISFGISLILER